MNYTKGERYIKQLNGHINICVNGAIIAESFGDIANAHLIAAAPDMHEALKALLRDYSINPNSNIFYEACRKARLALDKAEGK